MLESTKIKLLGVFGTFAIISTSYLLHAKTFYNELYTTAEVKERVNSVAMPLSNVIEEKTPIIIIKKPEKKVTLEEIKPEKRVVTSQADTLDKLLQKYRYLHVEKSGEISEQTKEALEKIIPLLVDMNNSYIELEGHSATEASHKLTQEISEQLAGSVSKYLNDKKIGKEIVVTGYGDLYPILDNTKDKQNSRVELKIRRR